MRGATGQSHAGLAGKAISIHAPHEGCDRELAAIRASLKKFQSTHPMRGATSFSTMGSRISDFNPRTP